MSGSPGESEMNFYVWMARLSFVCWLLSFVSVCLGLGLFAYVCALLSTACLIVFNIVVANEFRLWPFSLIFDRVGRG